MPAECYFLDVGQGTANVILTGDGRAIVIDCGPSSTPVTTEMLDAHRVDMIDALILSHNDRDHSGALAQILAGDLPIANVYYLHDRPTKDNGVFALLQMQYRLGRIPKPRALLLCDGEPRRLYPLREEPSISKKADGLKLHLIHPDLYDADEAEAQNHTNDASAVLVLRCGSQRVAFPGDASIKTWEDVYRRRNDEPLRVAVLAIPHHGGVIWSKKKSSESNESFQSRVENTLARLYTQIVPCRYAIISVGTARHSSYAHPRPAVVNSLCEAGARVLCTQITANCWEGDLNSVRGRMLAPLEASRSSGDDRATRAGAVIDVACATTVVAEIYPETVKVRRADEHWGAVSEYLSILKTDLCRDSGIV